MAEARGRFAWQQTSLIASLIVNANRSPKTLAVSPAEFDPYERAKRKKVLMEIPVATMAEIICRKV